MTVNVFLSVLHTVYKVLGKISIDSFTFCSHRLFLSLFKEKAINLSWIGANHIQVTN